MNWNDPILDLCPSDQFPTWEMEQNEDLRTVWLRKEAQLPSLNSTDSSEEQVVQEEVHEGGDESGN